MLVIDRCIPPWGCSRSTFLVMACVCGIGCLALTRLVARTRKVYKDLYKLHQAKDSLASKGNSGEPQTPTLVSQDFQEEASLTESPVLKASNMSEAQRHRHFAQSRMDSLE